MNTIVCVDRINNPKSENNGKWYVCVSSQERSTGAMKTVFMDNSKKRCVDYAKTLTEKPIVHNGIDYGARW